GYLQPTHRPLLSHLREEGSDAWVILWRKSTPGVNPLLRVVEGVLEPRFPEGFAQEGDRMRLERPLHVLDMGCGEDHLWNTFDPKHVQNSHAVEFRHLHVEKD